MRYKGSSTAILLHAHRCELERPSIRQRGVQWTRLCQPPSSTGPTRLRMEKLSRSCQCVPQTTATRNASIQSISEATAEKVVPKRGPIMFAQSCFDRSVDWDKTSCQLQLRSYHRTLKPNVSKAIEHNAQIKSMNKNAACVKY